MGARSLENEHRRGVLGQHETIDRTGSPAKFWFAIGTFGLSSLMLAGMALAMLLGLLHEVSNLR